MSSNIPHNRDEILKTLVGLSLEEAKYLLKTHDDFNGYKFIIRVIEDEGGPYIVTMDYRNDRINVATTNGKIIRVNGIG